MARILAGFSGPARKNEVARLVLARRSLLSQASPDDRRLNSTLQSLLALYARLRRRMGGELVEEAIQAGLIRPAASGIDAVASSPITNLVCVSVFPTCNEHSRTILRNRLANALAGRERDLDYCISSDAAPYGGSRRSDRVTSGADRNFAILLTAGRRTIWLEDLVSFDPWISLFLNADDRDCAAGGRQAAVGLICAFEETLGRRAIDIADRMSPPATDTSWEEAERWQRYRGDSWIATAQSGYVIDSQASREVSPRVFRTGRPLLIHHPDSIQLSVAALDNRRIMPPFPPRGDMGDAVFGHLLGLMYPNAVALEVPFAVVGDQRQDPAYADSRPSIGNSVLLYLLRLCRLPAAITCPETRLALAGRYLICMADMSSSTFRDFATVAALVRFVSPSRGNSADPGMSVGSQESQKPALEAAGDSLLSADILSEARESLACFGSLLIEWPAIWRAAACVSEHT